MVAKNNRDKWRLSVLQLVLKYEAALPAIIFSRYLPLPLAFIMVIVCLTVLLAQLTQDKINRIKNPLAQIGCLMFGGALNGFVCLLGIIAFIWLQDITNTKSHIISGVSIAAVYGMLFCVIRLVPFLLSLFVRNKSEHD
jgi:hypothetical protein